MRQCLSRCGFDLHAQMKLQLHDSVTSQLFSSLLIFSSEPYVLFLSALCVSDFELHTFFSAPDSLILFWFLCRWLIFPTFYSSPYALLVIFPVGIRVGDVVRLLHLHLHLPGKEMHGHVGNYNTNFIPKGAHQ